ncbi:MAG: DUF5931 domain-containing protein [Actinomycetota bacterium]|nr:DUF5931 domain-containing protein [Actinomycetota bacterium]
MTLLSEPAAGQVETQMMRALAVLRAVMLLFAVGVNAVRWRDFERPWLGVTVVAVMVVWSGVATWLYDEPARRRPWVFGLDLLIAVLAMYSSLLVEPLSMRELHAPTVPTYWVAAAVLAVAVHRGATGGLLAALIICFADVTVRVEVTTSTVGNVFLMLLAALVVGYVSTLLRHSAVERARSQRLAAVASERERLARAVHDGVLQVLSMVARRGAEPGSGIADLGRLAGAQEATLRALVHTAAHEDAGLSAPAPSGSDLAAGLGVLASPRVSVATPARPVVLPHAVVTELLAVVSACLDNVDAHVGSDAPVWILLEDTIDEVVLSVRDAGPGIPAGRLDAARREGRMGISKSICGRMEDLGGRAELVTAAGQGTEWELRYPQHPGARG